MIAKSSVPHPCEPSSYLIASGVLYMILNFWEFLVFIEREEVSQATAGKYSVYGLSKQSTAPIF